MGLGAGKRQGINLSDQRFPGHTAKGCRRHAGIFQNAGELTAEVIDQVATVIIHYQTRRRTDVEVEPQLSPGSTKLIPRRISFQKGQRETLASTGLLPYYDHVVFGTRQGATGLLMTSTRGLILGAEPDAIELVGRRINF